MKSFFTALLALLLILTIIQTGPVQAEEAKAIMLGSTIIPSTAGPGLGLRSWINPKMGWGAEIQPSWEFNDVTARGRFMYTIQTLKQTRWYGIATLGYMAVNEKEEFYGVDFEYSISIPTFAIGVGLERLYGMRKNHGLALEAGLQFGSGDFSGEVSYYGQTYPISGTFKVSPLYIGGSYTYYFKK
jgi:hypothetical protein